ncbi:MAG: RagB/SusD family nutrient uptake outer membrane protein [Bacteroidales bacterium]|nr:RagB/SusD family nutrient uptake outer membrane protein [Bacteroidales bacterium]
MKSNKITKWLLLCLSVVSLSACDITLYPEDKVTPGTYFRNETDLQLFTNNFYTSLPSAADVYADEADIIINPTLDDKISGQRIIPETGGSWTWTTLRQINYYLENSYRCEDAAVRNHYDGIARFFRALFYFEKVKRFGDVPWYDKVVGSGDKDLLYKPRDSRQYVMDKVLGDLDFAIANISETKDVYRVTKWAALALKSRVMLFEGTFRKYHGLEGWKECLEECVEASEELIKDGGYSLYSKGATPYANLFSTLNATETMSEIILARDYNNSVTLRHSVQNYTTSPTAGCTGVTRRLVDAYLMKDGSFHTARENYDKLGFIKECENRDPRMAQTLRTPGYELEGKLTPANLASMKLGYQLRKYYIAVQYDGFSEVDMPIFRLAEVYLNLAEAKAELGTLTQTDLDNTINKIRARAGVTGTLSVSASVEPWIKGCYPNLAKLNPSNMGVILEIRRERTVELVMEGFRYWDIMRWKEGKVFEEEFLGMYIPSAGTIDLDGDQKPDFNIATTNNPGDASAGVATLKIGENLTLVTPGANGNTYNGENGFLTVHRQDVMQRKWIEERDYLYPIPTKERVLTNGALKQNPGWDDKLGI